MSEAKKADISRANRKPTDGSERQGQDLLNYIGSEVIRPNGFKHVGSVAVHFYENNFQDFDYTLLTQISLNPDVPEGFADLGWKELRRALMVKFGRTPKDIA